MKPLHSSAYPPSRLLNPAFEYVSSFSTDIGKLFARVRAELAREQSVKVVQINARKK